MASSRLPRRFGGGGDNKLVGNSFPINNAPPMPPAMGKSKFPFLRDDFWEVAEVERFHAGPSIATSMPVCDDFDSYSAGVNLSEANPLYSEWEETDIDFVISDNGELLATEPDIYHGFLLSTTWETPGAFSLSIDFEFGGLPVDDVFSWSFGEFGIGMGDFKAEDSDLWRIVGATVCEIPGQCYLANNWDLDQNLTFVDHPFVVPFNETIPKKTLTVSADEAGTVVMTLDGESVEVMTSVEVSLPLDLDLVVFARMPFENVSMTFDNLRYTSCGTTRAPTLSPAPSMSPTVTPPLDSNTCHGAAVYGDPHFYTFRGQYFSYHGGGTEFILIKNSFIELHAHFEIVSDYFSGTTDVAFQVGGEIGQVALDGTFYKDGVVTSLPSTVGGYEVTSPSTGYFEIALGGCNLIRINGINDVRRRHVYIVGHSSQFDGSLGLLGSWSADGFVGRDGVSLMANETAFGEAWVVDSNQGDPDLFVSRRRGRRQLGIEDIVYPSLTVDLENPDPEAEEACGYIEDPPLYENCLFDVIATDDLTMAESEFYEEPISEVVMEEFCESNCNSNCEDAGGSCMFRCNSGDYFCVEDLCKFIDESKNDGVADDNDATVEGCSCGLPLGTSVADDAASCGGDTDDGEGDENDGGDEGRCGLICRFCD